MRVEGGRKVKKVEVERGGGERDCSRHPCARATEEGMGLDDLLCLRNARPQKFEREQATILLARRAPTIKRAERCPCRPFAPGTVEGMEADDLLCSRNARPPKALVGRAQWKINQPPSLKRVLASLEGLSVTSFDGRSQA